MRRSEIRSVIQLRLRPGVCMCCWAKAIVTHMVATVTTGQIKNCDYNLSMIAYRKSHFTNPFTFFSPLSLSVRPRYAIRRFCSIPLHSAFTCLGTDLHTRFSVNTRLLFADPKSLTWRPTRTHWTRDLHVSTTSACIYFYFCNSKTTLVAVWWC